MVKYFFEGKLTLEEERSVGLLIPSINYTSYTLIGEKKFLNESQFSENGTIPLMSGDRLGILNKERDIIFDEVLYLNRNPPPDFKFRYSFLPILERSELEFLEICLFSENLAILTRNV